MSKKRSRPYPVIDLEEATRLVEVIFEKLGITGHDRHEMASVIGHSSWNTGVAVRKVAALCHFDLVNRRNGRFSLTDLSVDLVSVESGESRQKLLEEAFESVDVFKELVERFSPSGRVPPDLPELLVEGHGITENAKYDVANIFMKSAQYAELVRPDGSFIRASSQAESKGLAGLSERIRSIKSSDSEIQSGEKNNDPQRFVINLDYGVFDLTCPGCLSQKDLMLIGKIIDFLEIQLKPAQRKAPLRWEAVRSDRGGG